MSKKRRSESIDWSEEIRKARAELSRSTERINAGETFKAHQAHSRKSPGQNKSKW